MSGNSSWRPAKCLLHPFGAASPDSGVGVKLVFCGEQLVGQIQALLIDDLVEDAPLDGLVVRGSHSMPSLLKRFLEGATVTHALLYH